MTQVLVVGLAVVDLLFEVTELPAQAEKYIASDAGIVGGGGAANAAVAISRLGGHARLAARIGDDMFGDLIVNQLAAESVDCSLIQRSVSARSSFSSVLVDQQGERQIVNFRGSGLSDDPSAIAGIKTDAVLADTRWLAGTIEAMKLAQQLGVPGVIDAEAPVPREAIALASHVAFSTQGLQQYTGLSQFQQALLKVSNEIAAWVCVTNGENGVFYIEDGKIENVPARSVDAVDTLGAGDVWHAAFTYALTEQQTEVEACEFANAAASLKCTRHGGGRNSPTKTEVTEFMNQGL